jgi:hypothetical protein
VLTIEKASLTPEHVAAAELPADLPVVGMDEVGGYFVDAILGDRNELDVRRAQEEHIAAAALLVSRHPDVATIVLECTNMPPYANAIRNATGLPVHDLTTLVTWIVQGQRRRRFFGWM